MLEQVLQTISNSNIIDRTVVVSKDENALQLAKQFGAITISDQDESGVNHAVSLADRYLVNSDYDASVVFPQDIPLMQTIDIDNLLKSCYLPKSVLVVPSRKFDGTNALVRVPVNLMKTHYDEDSYKLHLLAGKSHTTRTLLILIRRIMLDIDNMKDLNSILSQNKKAPICQKIQNLILD